MPQTATMVKGLGSEVTAPLVAAIAHLANVIAPSSPKSISTTDLRPDPYRAHGQEI